MAKQNLTPEEKAAKAAAQAKAKQEAAEKAKAAEQEKAEQEATGDKKKAEEIKERYGVSEVYKVDGKWFTNSAYAQAAAKELQKDLETF